MFVIESCQKIKHNALFMMIFIPVSNFGDQPLIHKKNPEYSNVPDRSSGPNKSAGIIKAK